MYKLFIGDDTNGDFGRKFYFTPISDLDLTDCIGQFTVAGVIKTFTGLVSGEPQELVFSRAQTGAMKRGVYRATLAIYDKTGHYRTIANDILVKCTDVVEEVYSGEDNSIQFKIDCGVSWEGITGKPRLVTKSELSTALSAIEVSDVATQKEVRMALKSLIDALKGVSACIAAMFCMTAFGFDDSTKWEDMPPTNTVKEVVEFYAPPADFSTNNTELVDVVREVSPTPDFSASNATLVATIQSSATNKLDKSGGTMTGGLTVPNLTVGERKGGSTIGDYSVAEGLLPEASGDWSHAEGRQTTASASASHAEGYKTVAANFAAHAEGLETQAIGGNSHAEGLGTKAIGSDSHAEGGNTIASGEGSHAEGGGTITTNDYEHAQGRFNASHKVSNAFGYAGNTLSSIGFGDNANRKNAVETMQDGKTFLYGLGGYDGTNPTGTGVQDLASAINDKASNSNLSALGQTIPNDISRTQTDAVLVHKDGSNVSNLFYIRQATHSLAGLMTAADKSTLDTLQTAVEEQATAIQTVTDEEEQTRQIVTTWENFLDGSNVVFSITNYISGTYSLDAAKMRILELRDGEYREVYNSRDEILLHINDFKTNDFRVATNQVIGAVNTAIENKADRDWGKYTSAGGEAPLNTVYMTAPNTVFAGGLEYERVAVGEGTICVLTTRGAPVWTQGDEGTFKFQDDGGTNYFGFAKTDSYTIGANTDGITVAGSLVTMNYNITMSGRPCVWYKEDLQSDTPWEQLNRPDGTAMPDASHGVIWENNPPAGTQVCYINVGDEPKGFFRATIEVAGEAKFMTNMPADLSGGIICTNTTTGVNGVIKPTFNGTTVQWNWSAL